MEASEADAVCTVEVVTTHLWVAAEVAEASSLDSL